MPTSQLRQLVSGSDDAEQWLRTGALDADLIRELVERNSRPLTEMAAILDFGCGCGRIARWWSELDGPRICGCDYDSRLTEWCRDNLAFLTVTANAAEPPLPFERESFDLIYGISLFTHMSGDAQDRWMLDVRRLLKPGGLLLFTVHGEIFTNQLTDEQRETFAAGKLVVQRPELNGMESCAAYHPSRFVRERLLPSAGLQLVDAIAGYWSSTQVWSPMVLQDKYLAAKSS